MMSYYTPLLRKFIRKSVVQSGEMCYILRCKEISTVQKGNYSNMETTYKYSRVLIKLSGETLKGAQEHGYDSEAVRAVVERIKQVVYAGVEVALVVGAGNIWRGVMGKAGGMDRVNADYMGMLATVMNAMCLKDFFTAVGISAEVQSAIAMEPLAKRFNRAEAVKALESGKVVIFAGGTGSPFFTTDTTAALRALETDCEAVLKATKVNGVYSSDPFKNPDAVRFDTLSFDEALARQLAVMDSTAFSLCRDNDLAVIVFDFFEPDSLEKVLRGDLSAGTLIN